MTKQGVCAALRLAWTQYLVHSNKVLNPLILQEGREKLVNLNPAPYGFGKCKVKEQTENANRKIKKSTLFTRQCNVIAGQRVWRTCQIVSWYRQLYGEKYLLQILRANLLRHCKSRKLFLLLSATYSCIFKWERDGVSDEELKRALSEMELMESLVKHAARSKDQPATPAPEGWEIFVDGPYLKVWRRFLKEYNLFEYRVYGSFNDITPRAFYNTQMDLKFWCGWDPQTIRINVIDTDMESNSEIIHWVYKYPYPMHPRDYCYVRRSMVNQEINKIVIRARAVPHHQCPEDQKIVRVRQYQSQLVIIPYTTFDQKGFNFYLTYFDNPQSQIPSICYNWMASTGVPDFVERLHAAAQVMQKRTQEGYLPHVLTSSQSKKQQQESKGSKVWHFKITWL